MIEVQNTIVSEDIFSKEFVCNLSKCKGACCTQGDSGAPLKKEELAILDEIYPKIKPLLSPKGIAAIEKQGKYVLDKDQEWGTTLVDNQECAYVVYKEDGTNICAIELAYAQNIIDYKKPISCHLYPIREKETKSGFSLLNYDRWDICSDACSLGKELSVSVFGFSKEPLIRRFGEDWYKEMQEVEQELHKQNRI
ncbi:MAG: DUF3109 domain-containing protein [Flavobacteriaceae bacterium]|nr:MAG: DUF3109 domain-containing protein [Flavobacteriaceae bacterium]